MTVFDILFLGGGLCLPQTLGFHDPIWRAYSSVGLKPPTKHGSEEWVPPIVVSFQIQPFSTLMIMGERVVLDFQMFFECFNTFHRMARWHALGKHAKPLVHKWVNVTLSNRFFSAFAMCDLSSASIFAAWFLLISSGFDLFVQHLSIRGLQCWFLPRVRRLVAGFSGPIYRRLTLNFFWPLFTVWNRASLF